jgi:pSer/pThr/pTyr-binding forkhead associated (FHA) protein
MKLTLVVLTPGKGEGKVIPITLSPFVIGRDPQCHLRPASPIISKRHCALLMQGGNLSVRDFGSTNGTFVNGEQVAGEVELCHDDRLQVGPLAFQVRLEVGVAVNQPTPLPPFKMAVGDAEDDAAATLLLSIQDVGGSATGGLNLDAEGIPQGSTVMEMLPPQTPDPDGGKAGKGAAKVEPVPARKGDTTEAAKAILEKYLRRTRA